MSVLISICNIIIPMFIFFNLMGKTGDDGMPETIDVGLILDIDKAAKTIPKNVHVTIKIPDKWIWRKRTINDKGLNQYSLHTPGAITDICRYSKPSLLVCPEIKIDRNACFEMW